MCCPIAVRPWRSRRSVDCLGHQIEIGKGGEPEPHWAIRGHGIEVPYVTHLRWSLGDSTSIEEVPQLRPKVAVALLTGLIVLLAGAVSLSFANEPRMGGTLVVGLQSDIHSLNVHNAGTAVDRVVLFHIIETLVALDDSGAVIPMLAEDWTVDEDGTVYTF